jgi:uncharacterized protein YbaR (Trm112 family)
MDARLLDILVCPICKANLEYRKAQSNWCANPAGWLFRSATASRSCSRTKRVRCLSDDDDLKWRRGVESACGERMRRAVMRFKVVIPARYASTRLPAKPLLDLGGKPMVVRVAERALLSGAEEVVVATDHAEVLAAVERHGLRAC